MALGIRNFWNYKIISLQILNKSVDKFKNVWYDITIIRNEEEIMKQSSSILDTLENVYGEAELFTTLYDIMRAQGRIKKTTKTQK